MKVELAKFVARLRTEHVWGTARILLGWMFLWAFLDKTFGLGHATSSTGAWINGGSPTRGYLQYGVSGVFESLFNSIAGDPVVDVLFMMGMLLLGVALILGIGMRIATVGGMVVLLLLWSSNVPPVNNPFIDQHIIYICLLIGLYKVRAGRCIGLGSWWATQPLVKRFPILE